MIDISAKWSKQLYEEARTEIAQVAVPKKTITKLIEEKTPTPNVPQTSAKLAIPKAAEKTLLGSPIAYAATSMYNVLFGSRESKAKTVSELIPANIETKLVTTPEYKPAITYGSVDIGAAGSVKVPYVKYTAGTVKTTDTGTKETTFKPSDYKTTTTTEPFSEYLQGIIDYQKANVEGAKTFWEQPVLGGTDITMPSIEFPDIMGGLGDLAKYAIIAGAVLIGAIVLTRK